MLLAWLHFIIGIVGGGLLIQLATVYVIYIDCICWRWCRICCTLLVVVIPGRGSIWENWKITRACVVWKNVCCGNKLKHNIKSHNLEFFQSIYFDTFSLVSMNIFFIKRLVSYSKVKKILITILSLIRYELYSILGLRLLQMSVCIISIQNAQCIGI